MSGSGAAPVGVSPAVPVALVTGAGRGIGAAIAAKLASRGHRVVAVDIDAEAAERTAAACGGIAYEADVADLKQNHAMVEHAVRRFGRLDVAVLNAGVASDQPPDLPLDPVRYRRALAVNVDGVAYGIDAAVPELARSGGRILVTGSLAGLAPGQGNPVYALTKAAVVAYVRALAPTLARRGVAADVLCPGFTDTAMLGIIRALIHRRRFPLLSPDAVADAALTVLAHDGTGRAWTVVAGRAPAPFAFPDLPAAVLPDGTETQFRPFLSPQKESSS